MRRINHTHPRRGIARTVTLSVIVLAFATAFVSSAKADAILYGTSGTPGSVGDLTASCSPGVVTALAPDIGRFAPRIGSGTATAHTRTTSTSSDRTSSGSRSERSSSGSTVPVGHTSVRQLAGRHRPRSQHRSYGCATVVAGPEHRRVVVGCHAVQQPAHRPQVWRSLRHLVVPLVVHAELFTRVRLRLESLRVLRRTRRNACETPASLKEAGVSASLAA